jgi:endonuclease/exonuclease/phosphatase family metal-dependent hydrolase
MRVTTLNLWNRFGDWEQRRRVLIEGFRALRPDLAAFQEAVRTEEYDQVADLLGPEYHVVHQARPEPDGAGIAVASRWPVSQVREVDLHVTPRTMDFPCAALVVETEVSGTPLLFVNHKPHWRSAYEREREMQALTTARYIEEMVDGRDAHVVVAGDFDATPEAASIRFWSGRQSLADTSVCYRDAWETRHPTEPGFTFMPGHNALVSSNWPMDMPRRIDYVFVRCGAHGPTLAISSCERIFDQPVDAVWASDHFGVSTELHQPRPHRG